MTDVKFSVPPT